jgi:sporulation protein YlmC with PRC-barrel domain
MRSRVRERSPSRLDLGCRVECADGPVGELADVVIDPTRRRVSHLVVQPHGQHGVARLVPVELARLGERDEAVVCLDCTVEEVRGMVLVQEFAYVRLEEFPVDDPDWDVGVQDVLAVPYYDAMGGYEPMPVDYDPHVAMNYDRVPKGEVEIRRSSSVTSSDGHALGHVEGFVVDPDDRITHVVLEHGHLLGKREITIPIDAVARVQSDAITLSLSKREIGELRPVPVHRWSR